MRNASQVIYTAPMNSVACFRFRTSWHAACVIVLLASTSACGQTGPLYLPDPTADMIEVRKPGTVAPSSDKKSRKRGAADSEAQSAPSDSPQPPADTEDE
jgi:predicted small lipoprotein YifL